MKSFFEKLAAEKVNFTEQVAIIENLLDRSGHYHISSRRRIETNYLRFGDKIRNTTANFDALINKTGVINKINLSDYEFKDAGRCGYGGNDYLLFEDYKHYCECVFSVISECGKFDMHFNDYSDVMEIANAITDNIITVVEKLNHSIKYIDGIFVIVEDNYEVTQAAEIIGDRYELGEQLYLFHHHSLKMNLNKKSDILCRLYKYFEGIRDLLKENDLSKLANNIGLLSEKTDTRHAPNEKEAKIIDGKTSEEMQEIYDTTFSLYLKAIIHADYITNNKMNVEKWVREFSGTN
ncbi:MAG: hypothetical protein FWE84_02525 [Firmicutes bacterium]|nr:hypothetical protein [Bacillota bacterium]